MATNKRTLNVEPEYLTGRPQISRYTGLSPRTISKLLADGRLPHRRLSSRLVVVKRAELDRVLSGVQS